MLHSFKPRETKEKEGYELEEETNTEERPLYLSDFLGKLVGNNARSDCTFVVSKGDKKEAIPAHRIVLAASSRLLEAMLYPLKGTDGERAKVSLPVVVQIKDTDPAVFKILLQCLYTDNINLDTGKLPELISLAQKYQIEKLQVACTEFMEKDVSAENVCELFEIAPKLLGDEEFGLSFIRENTDDVFASEAFLKLSPARLKFLLSDEFLGAEESSIFVALKHWGKHQVEKAGDDMKGSETDKLKVVLKDLITCIRFPVMDLEDIASHVAPTGLLDDKQMLSLYQYCALTSDDEREKFSISFPIKPRQGGKKLKFTSIMDSGGLFYFLGSGEGKNTPYANPVTAGKVMVTQSTKGGADVSSVADRNPSSSALENSYGSDTSPWVAVKIRDYLMRITELVICQDQDHFLQNWRLEGKYDKQGSSWVTIQEYKNDTSMSSASPPRFCYKLKTTKWFQEFRIFVTGNSHKGQPNYDITQLEFYGYYKKIAK